MKRGEESFPRSARLRSGNEFRKVLREGRRIQSPAFNLYVSREEGSGSRLGLIVPRRIGNAVTRNRIKRVLRELFRRSRRRIRSGSILVVWAAPGITTLRYGEISREFDEALRKAGLFRDRSSASEPIADQRGRWARNPEAGSDKR